jgi:hypothetical protein
MHLVKSIVEALQSDRELSESEIKSVIGKAKRDYGTTNNTLRRLCKHGVMYRFVGLSKRNRPSWMYQLKMDDAQIVKYIADKQAQVAEHKAVRNNTPFEFGHTCLLNTSGFDKRPLVIGAGLAPIGLENKCLVVSAGWDMHVTRNHQGQDVIHFTRKQITHTHKR